MLLALEDLLYSSNLNQNFIKTNHQYFHQNFYSET